MVSTRVIVPCRRAILRWSAEPPVPTTVNAYLSTQANAAASRSATYISM